MPIRASQRFFYPIDWPELSREIRFCRAGGACERCGRPHGRRVRHLGARLVAGRAGLWWDREGEGAWRCERGRLLEDGILAPPDALAARVLQPAFWAGLETPLVPVHESLVVLACCHLDHDPTNCADANLAALCQRCHLAHDRADNLARRKAGRRQGEGIVPAML